MIQFDKDGILRNEYGGRASRQEYEAYLAGQTPHTETIEIPLTRHDIKRGNPDDPCLCPLALAIKATLNCRYCEVWQDHILIDDETYDTTDKMKEFIAFFDEYGSVQAAEEFLGEHISAVFTLPVLRYSPAPQHISIPLSEYDFTFDRDDLQTLLERIAAALPENVHINVSKFMALVHSIEAGAEDSYSFFQKRDDDKIEFTVRVFIDESNTPELYFRAAPQVIETIRAEHLRLCAEFGI